MTVTEKRAVEFAKYINSIKPSTIHFLVEKRETAAGRQYRIMDNHYRKIAMTAGGGYDKISEVLSMALAGLGAGIRETGSTGISEVIKACAKHGYTLKELDTTKEGIWFTITNPTPTPTVMEAGGMEDEPTGYPA